MSVAAIAEQMFRNLQREFAVELSIMKIDKQYTFAEILPLFANPAFELILPLLQKHDAESIICLAGSLDREFDVAAARSVYAKMYDTNRKRLWSYVDALLQARKELNN